MTRNITYRTDNTQCLHNFVISLYHTGSGDGTVIAQQDPSLPMSRGKRDQNRTFNKPMIPNPTHLRSDVYIVNKTSVKGYLHKAFIGRFVPSTTVTISGTNTSWPLASFQQTSRTVLSTKDYWGIIVSKSVQAGRARLWRKYRIEECSLLVT